MASITIVWKPVPVGEASNGDPVPSGYYHMFLLYNDGTNTYYARGGPEANDGVTSGGSALSGSASGSGPGFGAIVTHHGLYRPFTPDFPKGPNPTAELSSWPKQNVISGDNEMVSQTWNLMINSLNRINDARIPYDLASTNPATSNSVIGTVLRDAGSTLQPPAF